ncbi:MAG: tRNA lysidine(34) synthetase TilS [Phycisphaeraceae bacterium]|nr:tRNA lysidine(34) synthetase TilS [Phycisphaeraceae bacterium]
MIVTSHPFVKAVDQALRHRCRVRRSARVLVAVSGGADSVALWHALCDLAPRRGWGMELRLAHVNHRVRPEADDDAAFAAGLDAQALTTTLDPATFQGNPEQAMRQARYAALRTWADQWPADDVAVAHHADDQLETMLMRLLRGSAARGLSAMTWRRRLTPTCALIRPMLGVTHEMAVTFLRDIGQPWREDATNADTARWRAKLRHEVLPVLRSLRPDASRQAVKAADQLRQARNVVDLAVNRAWRAVEDHGFGRDKARALPPLVLGGVLRKMLMREGVGGDQLGQRALGTVQRAIRDQQGGVRRFGFAGDVSVVVERETVRVERG